MNFQAAIDFLFDEGDQDWNKGSIESAVILDESSNSPKTSNSSNSPSTTISGFIDETEPDSLADETNEVFSTTSFSCNGTSELPRHIQDVRERVKVCHLFFLGNFVITGFSV